MSSKALRPLAVHVAVYMLYLGLAVLITWPLVTRMSSHLYGGFLTDAYQNARHAWWINQAWQTGQPLFFQPTMNYPEGLHGAWLWSNPLELFPAWVFAFFLPVPAAANLMLLTQVALDGWAVYFLVRRLTAPSTWPSVVAGTVFLAYPALQGRIYGGHVGILALWPVPLYLYALYRLRDDGRKRWVVLAAIWFMLGVAGSTSLLIYYLLPVAGAFLWMRLVRREWLWFKRGLIATVAGFVLLLGLLLPFIIEMRRYPQYNTGLGGSVRYSADLLSAVTPSFMHPIFKHLDYTGHVLGTNLVEGAGYVGSITAILVILAWRRHRREISGFALLAGVAWVFSLGPLLNFYGKPVRIQVDTYQSYLPLPWALVQNLPVIDISRTPGRFHLSVGLAMAIMAGYGAAVALEWARSRQRRLPCLLAPALIGLILFDYQMFWPMPSEPVAAPEEVAALAERADIRAVFNIPWEDRIVSKRGLYLQTVHQQNLLDGLIIRDTPVNSARLAVLQETLDPALLDRAGVDVVIYHKGGPVGVGLGRQARQRLGAPIYEDDTLAVFNVPEGADLPRFAAVTFAAETITTTADSYFYAPWPGWVLFSGVLRGDDRTVELLLGGEAVHRWTVEGEHSFDVALPASEEGFYTARLQLDPACPQVDHPALACRGVEVSDLALTFAPGTLWAPVDFERGIRLAGAYVARTTHPGERLPLGLWWQFDDPGAVPFESMSRFVHVLDADGESVAQTDGPVNLDRALAQWAEWPEVVLPGDLPPGTYAVVVGWYTFPDLTRLAVYSDAPEAVNGLIEIGAVEVRR